MMKGDLDEELSVTSLCSSSGNTDEGRSIVASRETELPSLNPSSRPLHLLEEGKQPVRVRSKNTNNKSWSDSRRRKRRAAANRKNSRASLFLAREPQIRTFLLLFLLVVFCVVLEIFLVDYFFLGPDARIANTEHGETSLYHLVDVVSGRQDTPLGHDHIPSP